MEDNNYGRDANGKSNPRKQRQAMSKDKMDDRFNQVINSRLEVMFQDEVKRDKMAKYIEKLSGEQEEEKVGNNIMTQIRVKRPKLMESTQTQLKRNKQSSGRLHGQTKTQHNGNSDSSSNDGNGNDGDNGNDEDDADDGLGYDDDGLGYDDDGLGDGDDDNDDSFAEMTRNNTQTQHRPRPTLNNRNDEGGEDSSDISYNTQENTETESTTTKDNNEFQEGQVDTLSMTSSLATVLQDTAAKHKLAQIVEDLKNEVEEQKQRNVITPSRPKHRKQMESGQSHKDSARKEASVKRKNTSGQAPRARGQRQITRDRDKETNRPVENRNTNPTDNDANEKDDKSFRYYKNVLEGGGRNMEKISESSCVTVEQLKTHRFNRNETETLCIIGVLLKVTRGKVPTQTGYQKDYESPPYNRAFMLYDAMDEFGRCFAVRCQTEEESKEFLRNITGYKTEPIIGVPLVLRNPAIHEGNETLGGNDVPLITTGSVHALTQKSSIWALQRNIPIKVPSEVVTRAFTIKGVKIVASEVTCIRSNCGHGTCDRKEDTRQNPQCFCMTTAPGNNGQNVLRMTMKACRVKNGNVINTKFKPFQSFRFSRFLLGNMIEGNTYTETEWTQCRKSMNDHCSERIHVINEDGGFHIFGWYKTGRKKAKLPPGHAQQASTFGGRSAQRKNAMTETFINDDITCHIIRIVPVKKKYEASWTKEENEYKMVKDDANSDEDDDDSYDESDEEYLEDI